MVNVSAALKEAPPIDGKLRQATLSDRSLLIQWTRAFQHEIGETANDTALRVDRALAAGQLWLWDNTETVSMAMSRNAVEGVVRLSGVYTATHKRNRGYATACVHAVSKRFRDAGYRCILYTDMANPTSNSIYRRMGYRAVSRGCPLSIWVTCNKTSNPSQPRRTSQRMPGRRKREY